jgi:hypothetical protein
VQQAFAKKYLAQSFTEQDWFDAASQEERRMMLRRGVTADAIVAALGPPLAVDAEGKLFERNSQRWLSVVCPSTQEHYLLAVPHTLNDSRYVGGTVVTQGWQPATPLDTPAKARRWTFGLPLDAEFVAEA